MKISSNALLRRVFSFKGNFKFGPGCPERIFDGIEIAPFKGAARAAVCVSADFELNWAWRELNPEERDYRGQRGRNNVPKILKILRDANIPITWATVGHLFLKECRKGSSGFAHPEMPRPPVNRRWTGDWYKHDPCTHVQADPLWYAPDLIQQILDQPTGHELGCHSFSHIDFSQQNSSYQLVKREIEECARAMAPYRLNPRSLVYPFNRMGDTHLDLLAELGVTSVRQRDEVRLSYPERLENGLYRIYESMNLRAPWAYDYLEKARIFIAEAIERTAVYHLWFHPSDPLELFQNEFRRIMEHVAQERDKGSVWVATMRELSAYCEARELIKLRVERAARRIQINLEGTFDSSRYGETELTLLVPCPAQPTKILLEQSNGGSPVQVLDPGQFYTVNQLILTVPASTRRIQLQFE